MTVVNEIPVRLLAGILWSVPRVSRTAGTAPPWVQTIIRSERFCATQQNEPTSGTMWSGTWMPAASLAGSVSPSNRTVQVSVAASRAMISPWRHPANERPRSVGCSVAATSRAALRSFWSAAMVASGQGVMTMSDEDRLAERLHQAEELIRAKNRLEQAMYDSDLEASWPEEAAQLERAYEQRYGVDLSADPDR